jgi:hypothetical protein
MTDTTPTTINRTVGRLANAAYRPREYLTEGEVETLRGSGDVMASETVQLFCWRIGMACERKNSVSSAGRKSICGTAGCTSIERRVAKRASIRYADRSYGHCGHCKDQVRTYSRQKPGRQ